MKSGKLFDHEKFNFDIARLKKGGETFEVVVDNNLAVAFKEGKSVDLNDVIKSNKIYSNANHSLLSSETIMENIFKTDDKNEIAKIILKEGEIHLTSEYKAKVREEKKKQIIYLIHKNSIDPRTNAPHTLVRIEDAINSKKVRIDEFKTANDQLKSVLDEIKTILPLKFEKKKYSIKIYSEYAARGISLIQRHVEPMSSDWQEDGSVICMIEISPGVASELIEQINKLTKGTADIESYN
ncbi:ribosome assembly factor SBDS [Candidatus Woesearchaeota archaeon]|nr:ribosome assembly factor SBDS [Candidatus Woesearchaeota archaeon]